MIEVLISFIYMGIFCLCIGSGILWIFSYKITLPKIGITGRIVTGIIALSVMVGWVSIFCRIGVAVHLIFMIIAGILAFFSRVEIKEAFRDLKEHTSWPEYLVGALIVLVIAYAASRGDFHTDTGIYHAAAIRLYEEYGVVRGIANLQLHYGYNSSYLGFASFFTMSAILPNALHTTTGFLMALFSLNAFGELRDIRSHRYHYADAVHIVLLMYVFMNLTGAMSPATDYATNMMTGYFLCSWLKYACKEYEEKTDYTDVFALLSVYGLFLATMKLSAAMCVSVVLLPVIRLIRGKEFKKILGFVITGLVAFLFYPIRNVILSGWLFYPFEAIDLFNVEWKVPLEYSLIDSAQIKVWGRCLFDVSKVDMPVSGWLPIWWEWQEHYDQMMIYAVVIGFMVIMITPFILKKIRPAVLVFYVMVAANLIVWFFSAPFVRYGLIFLMSVPATATAGIMDVAFGRYYEDRKKQRLLRYAAVMICVLMGFAFSSRLDHYLMDDLVFAKQNLSKPYYVMQQPFDDARMAVEYIGDAKIPVYYTDNPYEKNSYYNPPSTCYKEMLDRTEPMGNTIKDGFKAK